MKNTIQLTVTLAAESLDFLKAKAAKMEVPPKIPALIKHIVECWIEREKRKGDK